LQYAAACSLGRQISRPPENKKPKLNCRIWGSHGGWRWLSSGL
jgi:hypothetical protein